MNKAFSKVKSVTCTRGTGTMSYKLNGTSLALTIDEKYGDKKDKGSGQRDNPAARIKKEQDK